MSESMGSEFSPQQRPEARGANLSAAGDVVVSDAVNKLPAKERTQVKKKLSRWRLALAGATVPFILSCGWVNNLNPFVEERAPTPTIRPKETIIPKVEIHQTKVISINGYVEADAADPYAEKIKLVFPEGTIDGKSPLIPEGDTLSVSVKLKSERGIVINQCSLSLSDLFGIKDNIFNMVIFPNTNGGASQNISSSLSTFRSNDKFSISYSDRKIINKTTLSCVRDSNGDLMANLSFPNKSIRYVDKEGSHLINPAERLASGKVGLGIKRGNIASSRYSLTAENIRVQNNKARLVATSNKIDLIPARIPVVSGRTQSNRTISTETPTHTPVPTMSQETTKGQRPASADALEISYPELQLIDGMETYGDKNPLTQEQLLKLYEKLNSVEQEMRDDTYYGTIFVSESTYKNFLGNFKTSGKHHSFQSFLKINEEAFNNMVHEQPYPDTNKLHFRRLIVLGDSVVPPDVYSLRESGFIQDSDGGWYFNQPDYLINRGLNLYYNKNTGIDWGFLHEVGHSVFNLTDEYNLEIRDSNRNLSDPSLEDIPVKWRNYLAGKRGDIGKSLMFDSKDRIGLYANLQLKRRLENGDVHNKAKTLPEVSGNFLNEVPSSITFSFGKEFKNANLEIFRSKEADKKKSLYQIGEFTNSENGELTIPTSTLFQTDFEYRGVKQIKASSAVLLIKIRTTEGKSYFRWMDIRDFNIPYWQARKFNNKEHVIMNFKLATEKDDPNTFDWRILYAYQSPATP